MDLLQESLVEVDDILPVVDVRNNDSLLLGGLVSNDGVVDGDTLKVVVDSVCEGDESVGDVGTVVVKLEGEEDGQRSGDRHTHRNQRMTRQSSRPSSCADQRRQRTACRSRRIQDRAQSHW